jgi:transcriptional antiterminator NusG
MVNEEEINEVEDIQPQEEPAVVLPADTDAEEALESSDEPISSSSTSKIPIEESPIDETLTEQPAPSTKEEEEDGRAWFVIHCYSGYEKKVRHNLEQRIETMGMKNMIYDVVIPTQEEIEVKEGKRRSIERHVFPGYVLVNMILTEESWYVVRNTPGVTGFVGMGNEPTPLRTEEVAQILKRMEAEAPHVMVSFKQGERVRIIDGPFNDFRGTVSEIDIEHAKVTIMVNFFGRETPVEVDFLQVEKS